jgi:hypothetical protein
MFNKSVAVILNGCIRNLDNVDCSDILENFSGYQKVIDEIKYLLKDFQVVHIYYHTWNSFDTTNIKLGTFAYNKEKFYSDINLIVYKLILEDQYTQDQLDEMQVPITKQFQNISNPPKANRTSIYNCFKAYKSLCDNVKNSGIHYDYILRSRNDLVVEFMNFKDIIQKSDENYICIPVRNIDKENEPIFTNDHFAFGKAEIMLTAFSYSSFDEFKLIVNTAWNQEEINFTYLSKCAPIFRATVSSYNILHGNRKLL